MRTPTTAARHVRSSTKNQTTSPVGPKVEKSIRTMTECSLAMPNLKTSRLVVMKSRVTPIGTNSKNGSLWGKTFVVTKFLAKAAIRKRMMKNRSGKCSASLFKVIPESLLGIYLAALGFITGRKTDFGAAEGQKNSSSSLDLRSGAESLNLFARFI
jgi:hypothetical protein